MHSFIQQEVNIIVKIEQKITEIINSSLVKHIVFKVFFVLESQPFGLSIASL